MRVVHVNYEGTKLGGASMAMCRTIEAQRQVGIDAIVACRCHPIEEYAHQHVPGIFSRCCEFASKVMMKLTYGHCYSTGLINMGMADFVNSLHPDVVQLNWLQANTIGIRELTKIKVPIVWFTHDLWPLSGISPFFGTDWFKYGEPKDSSFVDRLTWRTKYAVVQEIKERLHVVGPSDWAARMASESKIFSGVPSTCIHYPLSNVFEKACVKMADEPKSNNDEFVILFGATTGISLPIKGWDRLMSAMDLLTEKERKKIVIKVFGCSQPSEKMHGVNVEFLGRLNPEQLIRVYHSADLFAFPSRSETWGQVKVESMCCGTPVIAFQQTACADGIEHKKNGWIAPKDDIESFAEGVRWFMHQKETTGITIQADEIIREYSMQTIGSKWKSFYEELLEGVRGET